MFSGEVSIPQEIVAGISEARNVYNSLEDFPMWMRVIGSGFSQASRGQRLYREIKNMESEFSTPILPKFKQYLDVIKAPAVGFNRAFTSQLDKPTRDILLSAAGDITRDMFEAGNRQASIRRNMIRNRVPISQLRQITDPEVRTIISTIPSHLKRAFERNIEIPEDQLLELAMFLNKDS